MTTYEITITNGDKDYATTGAEEGGCDNAVALIREIVFEEIKNLAQAYKPEELPDNQDLPERLTQLAKFAAQIPVIEDVITGPGTYYYGGLIQPYGQLDIVEIEED